mmetsp:Transcript_18950/g.39076  ORF Transcript_18950/g.39076 Transcript_18950/m.39076 type:complete len:475 (+) Transcript_18950:18-1442(+)
MEDFTRCFPVPSLPKPKYSRVIHQGHESIFRQFCLQLATQCWNHYDNNTNTSNSRYHHFRNQRHAKSIYAGSLGTSSYVKYYIAQSLSWTGSANEKDRKHQLLINSLAEIENVLNAYQQPSSLHQSTRRPVKITLLEGERVGALSLKAAVCYDLKLCSTQKELAENGLNVAKLQLLEIGRSVVLNMPLGECEVLYGRAGFLQAIAFVRSKTNDTCYGENLVKDLCKSILEEGRRLAKRRGVTFPFLWEWYGKIYLGAAHGFVGILHTLLSFAGEIRSIKVEGRDEEPLELIEAMILKLDDMCFLSGNLKPALGESDESDRLVHFCHGAPGHILLLTKAFEVYNNLQFLERAEVIAHKVLCRRGLIRKGVGLCHGIAGNAYCFLSLYRARKLRESQIMTSQQQPNKSSSDHESKSDEWLQWADHFAMFAIEHFDYLKDIPDHPYSLFEGAAGLITLLHDLASDPALSRFPCFVVV